MSTSKTEHLQLHQWQSTDEFRREEFNENFAKLDAGVRAAEAAASAALSAYQTANDAAVGALSARTPKVAVGTYQGAAYDNLAFQEVAVGFAPKAVVVWANQTDDGSSYAAKYAGFAVAGTPLGEMLYLTETGFKVRNCKDRNGYAVYPRLNEYYRYSYFAIG